MYLFDRCVPVFGNVLPGALPSDEVSRVTFWSFYLDIESYEGMTDYQRGTGTMATKNRSHIVYLQVKYWKYCCMCGQSHCVCYFSLHVQATAYYIFQLRKIILTYGLVVGTNYLVVFVLLVTTYCKILFFIKTIRKDHRKLLNKNNDTTCMHCLLIVDCTLTMITAGQSNVA